MAFMFWRQMQHDDIRRTTIGRDILQKGLQGSDAPRAATQPDDRQRESILPLRKRRVRHRLSVLVPLAVARSWGDLCLAGWTRLLAFLLALAATVPLASFVSSHTGRTIS